MKYMDRRNGYCIGPWNFDAVLREVIRAVGKQTHYLGDLNQDDLSALRIGAKLMDITYWEDNELKKQIFDLCYSRYRDDDKYTKFSNEEFLYTTTIYKEEKYGLFGNKIRYVEEKQENVEWEMFKGILETGRFFFIYRNLFEEESGKVKDIFGFDLIPHVEHNAFVVAHESGKLFSLCYDYSALWGTFDKFVRFFDGSILTRERATITEFEESDMRDPSMGVNVCIAALIAQGGLEEAFFELVEKKV